MRVLVFVLCLLAPAAIAQEGEGFTLGGDVFLAGGRVAFDAPAEDDLFVAGDRVSVAGSAGSTHAAGRRLGVAGPIGGDLFAAGFDVSVTGPVEGDASVAGYDVRLTGEVGGDLRASGSDVALEAPVGGYALVAAESVRLNAPVAGDASLTGREIAFGDAARVDGTLTLVHPHPDDVEVPATVAPAERVVRRQMEAPEPGASDAMPFGWRGALGGVLGGILVTGAIAFLVAAVAPERMATLRSAALARPFRTIWLGFLTLSALAGAGFVLVLTVIGIVISPAAFLVALAVGFAGYIVGVYALGAGLLSLSGRSAPRGTGERAVAAFAGAAVAVLAALVPLLGWIFVFALVLLGTGAMTARLLRLRFFAEAAD